MPVNRCLLGDLILAVGINDVGDAVHRLNSLARLITQRSQVQILPPLPL
jgi:hypothetical protein